MRDEGIGITEADQENLFEPFFRSTDPTSISKNKYGNGLGLSICKMIAEKMDGSLKIKSEAGEGCTFIFTFVTPYDFLKQEQIKSKKIIARRALRYLKKL